MPLRKPGFETLAMQNAPSCRWAIAIAIAIAADAFRGNPRGAKKTAGEGTGGT